MRARSTSFLFYSQRRSYCGKEAVCEASMAIHARSCCIFQNNGPQVPVCSAFEVSVLKYTIFIVYWARSRWQREKIVSRPDEFERKGPHRNTTDKILEGIFYFERFLCNLSTCYFDFVESWFLFKTNCFGADHARSGYWRFRSQHHLRVCICALVDGAGGNSHHSAS